MVMVCAQLVAFGRVNRRRGEKRERNEEARKRDEMAVINKKISLKDVALLKKERLNHETNGSLKAVARLQTNSNWEDRKGVELLDGSNGHILLNDSDVGWVLGR